MHVCMYVKQPLQKMVWPVLSRETRLHLHLHRLPFLRRENIVNTFFFKKFKKSVHDCRPNLSQESYRHRLHRLLRALRRFLSPAQRIADLADDLCWAPMSEYDRTLNVIIHTYIHTYKHDTNVTICRHDQ